MFVITQMTGTDNRYTRRMVYSRSCSNNVRSGQLWNKPENWDGGRHNLDQQKAMESNMIIEKLQVMMQHGKKNITISRYKGKQDNTRQSITRGEGQHLYGIERHRARGAKR